MLQHAEMPAGRPIRLTAMARGLGDLLAPGHTLRQQLEPIFASIYSTLASGIVVALILAWLMSDSPIALEGYAVCAGVVTLSVIGSLAVIRLRRRGWENDVAQAAWTLIAFAFLRGAVWAGGFLYLMINAGGDRQTVLGWMLLGLVSGGVFSYWTLPLAGLAFSGTLSLAGFLGFMLGGVQGGFLASLSLVAFLGLLVRSSLTGTRQHLALVESNRSLAERNEVINLLLRDFEDNASDWLWETDAGGRLLRGTGHFNKTFGAESKAFRVGERLPNLLAEQCHCEAQRHTIADFAASLAARRPFTDCLVSLGGPGHERWWHMTAKPIIDTDGSFHGWRGVAADVTAEHVAAERVQFLAHYDVLTGLPNRTLFLERLHDAFAAPAGDGGIAVLYLDLDGFKSVNDTLGHPVGDALLKAVAQRIAAVLGNGGLLCRLGGDEFAIKYGGRHDEAELMALAARIIDVVSQPYEVLGHVVLVGISAGIAMRDRYSRTPDEILRHADLALYRAKNSGRGIARLFDASMDRNMRERRQLEVDLRQALARNQFELYYQPIFNIVDNCLVGYEALLRWHHPQRGLVPPADFITIAEETGLIVEIGEWVLHEACRSAATWPSGIRIAVNLSPLQLTTSRLLHSVVSALADSGLAPGRLELEITENALLERTEQVFSALENLKHLGVRIALDDFGTGYSSLAYLHSFGFDKIKIDRSFVHAFGNRKESSAVINAVLLIADQLGMTTTAEGIEDEIQLAELRQRGCREGQGYLLGRPAPLAAGAVARTVSS